MTLTGLMPTKHHGRLSTANLVVEVVVVVVVVVAVVVVVVVAVKL